jgi:hypothetical protein
MIVKKQISRPPKPGFQTLPKRAYRTYSAAEEGGVAALCRTHHGQRQNCQHHPISALHRKTAQESPKQKKAPATNR